MAIKTICTCDTCGEEVSIRERSRVTISLPDTELNTRDLCISCMGNVLMEMGLRDENNEWITRLERV